MLLRYGKYLYIMITAPNWCVTTSTGISIEYIYIEN
jgi:hypothetical protein